MTVRSLPFSSSTLRSSASAYFVPSWKMWPISMPRADSRPCPHEGQASPSRTSAASMVPSAVKSRPATRSIDVAARLVGAGHPRGALADPGVEQVADAGRLLGAEHARADVALRQRRGAPRSPSRRRPRPSPARPGRRAASRRPRGRRAGRWPAARGCRRGARARRARSSACRTAVQARPSERGKADVQVRDERVDGGGVGGVLDVRGGHAGRVDGIRHRDRARPRRWRRSRSWCSARRCPRRSRRSRGTPPTSSHPSPRPSPGR